MRPTAETLTSPTRADKELVATAKAGDEMSFQTLFKRHQTRIFALALRYTRIHEDAEDIVQQTFQKAFVHLPRFEGRSAFSTWLTRIAINESIMFLRRVRVLREIPIDDSSGDEGTERLTEPVDTALDPEAVFLVQERAQILTSALGRLKPATRKALELLELRELSTAETARHLGVSVGAVKARVFHGRRKLRRMFRGCMGLPRMAGLVSQNRLACDGCD
jgi:RNA polymerase sigma-70 factor, ECF subfamily